MQNAELEEAQAGIKIAGRNINNLRYTDDTTFMAESEEELKSLLIKVKKESETVGLKLNIQKTKIMASSPTTSWEIDGETVETVSDFTADGDCSHEIKSRLSWKESYDQHRWHAAILEWLNWTDVWFKISNGISKGHLSFSSVEFNHSVM